MINLDFLIGDELVIFLCEVLLSLCILLSFYRITSNPQKKMNNYALLVVLMLCYSLLYSPEEGDSYSTFITFQSFQSGADYKKLHLEPVYFFLMTIFAKSYIFWRFSVWGIALFLYVSLMKRFKCNANVALFIWAILGLQAFYYQRVALAIAMMFYGVVLFEEFRIGKKEYKKLFLALILFFSSYFFHRSMIIYLLVSILILVLPNKKWQVILCLLLIPILLSTILSFIPNILSNTSDELQAWGEGYLNAENTKAVANFNGMLFEFVRWTPFTAMMIFCLFKYLKRPFAFSIYEKYFLLLAVILYSLYFLLQGQVAYAFAGKMKMQSILAMSMFLVIYLKDRLCLKSSRLYIISSFLVFLVIQVYTIFW